MTGRRVCGTRWPGACESSCLVCAHGPDHACVRPPRHPAHHACRCGARLGGYPPGSVLAQMTEISAAFRDLAAALAGLWRLWLVVYAAACLTVIGLLAAGVR